MKICFLYLIIAGMLMISCNTKPERSKPAAEVINDSVYNEPSEHPIYDQLREEMDSTEIYDDNIIYGMWFEPHGATHNIIFHKNHTFKYNTFDFPDDETVKDTIIEGTFTLEGDSIVMTSHNGWVMKLRYWKRWKAQKNDDTKYLTGNDDIWEYYFVKGSD